MYVYKYVWLVHAFFIYHREEFMLLYLSLIDTEEDKIKFEDIFNSYKKTMYYIANSILKDEHYSHDAVQNSFLKIIKHIDKIEDVKCNKTKGFIVTIVRNSSIDIYRKLQIEKNKVRKLENEILSFEQEVYDTDTLPNKVEVAILKLPERYKQVFFLKYGVLPNFYLLNWFLGFHINYGSV